MNSSDGRDLRDVLLSCQQEHKDTHSWLLWLQSAHEAGDLCEADGALVRYLSNVNLLGELFSGSWPKMIPMPGVSPGLRALIEQLQAQPEIEALHEDLSTSLQRQEDFASVIKELQEEGRIGESQLQEARKHYHRLVKGCDGEIDGLRKIADDKNVLEWPGMIKLATDSSVPESQTGSLLL